MQINPIHFMQDIPPGVAQIKQHFQTLQKKQKSLSNYPKTILKLREFKEAYPLIPRYISKYATNETITHNNKPVYVRYFNQSEKALKLIIFFPGGNFCFNQQYDYDLLCEALINDNTQLLVMPPVLAPENIFPSAHEKSLELVTHVIQNREKYMPGNEVLLVATGSGCHIANWVYQRLPNRSTIKKIVLIDGLYQINTLALLKNQNAESLSSTLGCYFVDHIHNDPTINQIQFFNPYHHPVLFVSGSDHPLCSETVQMASVSAFNCKKIDMLTVPGAIDEFLMYDGVQQREALQLISSWINS